MIITHTEQTSEPSVISQEKAEKTHWMTTSIKEKLHLWVY